MIWFGAVSSTGGRLRHCRLLC